MDCAAQSRKSNLFRIAVFNHIFHFVQRQRQPNSPTPPVPPPSPPSSPSLATRQDLQLPALYTLLPILFAPFGYINLLCSASAVAALSVQSCSIKKAQMRFRSLSISLSLSLLTSLSLALFSAHFACATKEVLERKRKSRKTAHRLNCI